MGSWHPPGLPSRWTVAKAPPFVGRQREFDLLERVWGEVDRGARRVVFVGGEAGAGKSRLVAEAGTRLHAAGAAVLLGRCLSELPQPYEPFVEPLRVLREAVAAELLHPRAAMAGDVVERLDTLTGLAAVDTGGRDPRSRTLLYDAATAVLVAAAAERPVVLVLEDLHWAGETTVELLSYLVHHTDDANLLVLGTHRNAPPDQSSLLMRAQSGLLRVDGVERLDLTPLSDEDIAAYVRHETGTSYSQARVLAPALRTHTGGNPFLLREVLRDVGNTPAEAFEARELSAPETVRELYQSRLDSLGADERHVIEVAAVVGDDFEVGLVAAATGREPSSVLGAIDTGASLGLLEAVPAAPGSHAFVHSLARQSVLGLMAPSALALANAAVGEALDEHFPAADNRTQRLANHFASAQALGYAERAVVHLRRAGDQAAQRLALAEAGEMYERAAALCVDPEERDELRLRAADRLTAAGAFEDSHRLCLEVFAQGSSRDRLRAAMAYEEAAWRVGEPGHATARMLTAALEEPDVPADDPLRVLARASRARALFFMGEDARAWAEVMPTISAARSHGDWTVLAHALACAVNAIPSPSSARTMLDLAVELKEMAVRHDVPGLVTQAGSSTQIAAYTVGDLERFEVGYADVAEAAARTGEAFFRLQVGCYTWGRQFAAGDLVRAAHTHQDLLAMDLRGGAIHGLNLADRLTLQTFLLKRERDDLGPARALLDGSEDVEGRWPPGLLAFFTEFGLHDGARRIARLIVRDLDWYVSSATWAATASFLAEAALALRDRDLASRVRPALAAYSGCHLIAGPSIGVFGSADRYLGHLDAVLGRPEAEEDYLRAAAGDAAMGAALFRAYDLAGRWDHLRRSGAPGRRIEQARAEAVAAIGDTDLPRLRRRLDLAPAGATRSRSARPDGLTQREIEVLGLLAEGLSNRELAERLVISENTVTNHVRSILMKTGCENRTKAAMYAVSRGLAEERPDDRLSPPGAAGRPG